MEKLHLIWIFYYFHPMKRLLFLLIPVFAHAQYDGNTTPTYTELIDQYKKWDAEHEEIWLFNMGNSDTEYPLYVCLINAGSDPEKAFEKARTETCVLVNNAIHPGEPDGVNACLLWIQEWIKEGKKTKNLPVIAIIPAYNVGGMLNRSGTSRANQDGPEDYGFRGNAQNLDLNRDFIKMDSENARTFTRIYQELDPDVFVDTHVSNGADYQYTLTLITSLKERLEPSVRELTYDKLLPEMTRDLKREGWDWAPYVETKAETPDSGIVAFNDLPRYAMGYASLFHSLSFTVETHMLKPFPQRVQSTLDFLDFLFEWTGENAKAVNEARVKAIESSQQKAYFKINYHPTEQSEPITFKGYEAIHKPSEVTGLERLYYDRTKPFTKQIPFYNVYQSSDSIRVPEGYIVSREATAVISRLKENKVEMKELTASEVQGFTFRVQSYKSGQRAYEGHFLHHSAEVAEQEELIAVPAGSYYIPTNQARCNFILSVLEPRAEDSYFNWNFMDSYLQEKEYFSAYVFEDKALEILNNNPELKKAFEEKKKNESAFASDSWGQLFYIYQHSEWFEAKTFNRLPVFKVYGN